MSTERPRIQAYLEPELHNRFLEWKRELGIAKDSEALNVLLAEYFGVSQSPISNPQSPTTDELRILIQEELWDSGKRDFLEGIKLEAQAMISKEVTKAKAYWEQIDTRELIKDFRMELEAKLSDLAVRLDAVEDSLEVVLNESPSESLAQSEDTRSPGQLPQDSTPGLEEDESSSADVEPDTEEELAKDSLADKLLPGESPGELGNNALARRLGVNGSTVLKNRDKPSFAEWSKAKDPDAIAWRYDRKKQKFFPIGGA